MSNENETFSGAARGELDSLVVRGGLLTRRDHFRENPIDADEADLRDVQSADGHFAESFATPDVENPVARPRLQRFRQEFGEFIVPPRLPEMLEGWRCQGVDRGRHVG